MLGASDIAVDLIEDDDLASGFAWGRQGPLPDTVPQAVAKLNRAAVIEVSGLLHQNASRVASVGRALREDGGVAVRMEASGAASMWEPWLEHLESAMPARLYAAAVLLVGDGDAYFTCGMHHFDLPDAQITMSDPRAAIEWLDNFCIYQLAEQPALASGHTFAPDAQSPRRVLERWPDHRHHPEDGRQNPFGVWRFLAQGQQGVEASSMTPVIMPSLAALLSNAERSAGKPLTRREVEGLVSSAPAVTMEHARARELERSRGYADIEPELAWEQWLILREGHQ